MTIYPAIDIKGGRCVRLLQGRADQETVYGENPAAVAAEFRAAGSTWVHVVDLDGAFAGEPQNLAAVQAIVALGMKVQLGGGLRTRASVERALGFGVSRVVIGTRAAEMSVTSRSGCSSFRSPPLPTAAGDGEPLLLTAMEAATMAMTAAAAAPTTKLRRRGPPAFRIAFR